MNDAKALPATPWDFKARALVFGIIYGLGFMAGINLQLSYYGNIQPTYALIGERFGLTGIHAAAFLPVFFTLSGYVLRVWGTAYLSSGVVWNANVSSGGLLLSGPYRYVRNPLYLGNLLVAVGIGLLGPPFSMLIIVVGVTAFVMRLISVEERYLTAVYGQAYHEYTRLVPRLIPRLTPAPIAIGPRPPAWSDGFWGETLHLAFVLATLYNALFSWRQPSTAMWVFLVVALLFWGMIRRFITGKSFATQ